MPKLLGHHSIERLANAPRPPPVVELASALQDCFDQPYGKVQRRCRTRAAQEVKNELVPRLDRLEDTLRLMWRQMKVNGKLPIDV